MKLYVTQKYLNEKFQTYSDALKNVFDLNADFQIVDLYSTITNNIVNYTQDILFYVTKSETNTATNVTYDSGFYFYSNTTKIVTPFNMNSGTAIYIQSTAPSDTTGLWIDNTDPSAVDMKLYDEIVSDWYSLNNMNYSNVIIISKDEYDAIPEDERKAGYYYLVYDDEGIIDDLTGGIIIYEFDETNTTRSYAKGSYVIYNTSIYRCIAETGSTAGAFDETEWEVIGGTLASSEGIAIKEFDITVEYQANEYVIYNNAIYKANIITTIGSFIESEWNLISGTKNKSNVIVMSEEEYDALPEEEKNSDEYFHLVYDADGNISVNSSSNTIKIKDFDSTISYVVDECVVYNNKLYRATTTTSTGSFVESEWSVLGGNSSDVMNIIGDLNELPEDCDKTSVVNAIKQVFQSSNNAQNQYETAIIGKGGTVSKANSVASMSEILAGIESINIGEDITDIHNVMVGLGYTATDLTNIDSAKTAHIISKWFVLKTATDSVDTILDVANTDTFTDWVTDDEITDFGDYINPNYSATQLSVSEDTDSGLFVSEEFAVHELYTINEGEVD